jgi:hypothetical protein
VGGKTFADLDFGHVAQGTVASLSTGLCRQVIEREAACDSASSSTE